MNAQCGPSAPELGFDAAPLTWSGLAVNWPPGLALTQQGSPAGHCIGGAGVSFERLRYKQTMARPYENSTLTYSLW